MIKSERVEMTTDQEMPNNFGDDEPEASAEQSINSRTRHLTTTLLYATRKDAKLQALNGLLHHLHNNPQSQIIAVKEKAVSALLKQRHTTEDEDILSLVREALCLLGYVDPPKGHGIRILSLDGGGVRGIIPVKAMMKLEEYTQKPIHELFDYVCGVSTGVILACSIFAQKRSLDEVLGRYKELSKQVFQSKYLSGAFRMARNHGYYDTTQWERLLQDFIGHTKMIHTSRDATCPKISAISTVANTENISSFIFRNYELRHSVRSQYHGSSKYSLWEAIRASSAAPGYFKEFPLDNLRLQDGGLRANNPSGIAIHESRLLWPGVPIQCLVSLGTGQTKPDLTTKSTSYKKQLAILVDSATDTENNHQLLSDLLPPDRYYRFNPYLMEMIDLSEIRQEKIDLLESVADGFCLENEAKFKAAAQKLLEPRTTAQRFGDWLSLRANMLGLKANL